MEICYVGHDTSTMTGRGTWQAPSDCHSLQIPPKQGEGTDNLTGWT